MVPHSFCALTEASRLLMLAVHAQLTQHGHGNFEVVREVAIMMQLYSLIRAGICTETRTVNYTEIPGLRPLLSQLPSAWERRMIDAITGELSGYAYHGKVIVPLPQRCAPRPLKTG